MGDDATLDHFRLAGKVAVVTGAGKGIGAGIARALADVGADVMLVARTRDDLDAVAEELRGRGRRAAVQPADVTDLDALARVVQRTMDDLGGIDIVVNNAGGTVSRPFLDSTAREFEDAFRFNVTSAFELSRLAVPHMLARGGGAIVNISSMASRNANRSTVAYGTAKAALNQLTRTMAADLAPRVRVNAVLPGAIETEALGRFLSTMDPSIRETMRQRTPMRRSGLVSDIADAVVFLASDASSWMTGKLVEVDGGAEAVLIPKDLPDL